MQTCRSSGEIKAIQGIGGNAQENLLLYDILSSLYGCCKLRESGGGRDCGYCFGTASGLLQSPLGHEVFTYSLCDQCGRKEVA